MTNWLAQVVFIFVGGLYFANVLSSDFQNGGHYVCVVGNEVLGKYVQGNDQKVQPDNIGGKRAGYNSDSSLIPMINYIEWINKQV